MKWADGGLGRLLSSFPSPLPAASPAGGEGLREARGRGKSLRRMVKRHPSPLGGPQGERGRKNCRRTGVVARMERSGMRDRPFPDFAALHPGYDGILNGAGSLKRLSTFVVRRKRLLSKPFHASEPA